MTDEVKGTGKIVAIRPLDKEILDNLEAHGIDPNADVDVARLEKKLDAPKFGEVFVRHLEDDEQAIFAELNKIDSELEDKTRDLIGRTLTKMGGAIQDSDRNKPWFEALQEMQEKLEFQTDEEEEAYCALQQRLGFLHSVFHWTIGDRTGNHSWRLGVRKPEPGGNKLRVVKMQKRLTGKPAQAKDHKPNE